MFSGGCMECVSIIAVYLGCSLVGVWSACLRERCT